MIATTHLAVGAAVGLWSAEAVSGLVATRSPSTQLAAQMGTAWFAGTVSHFVLDSIPHSELIYKTVYKTPILAAELVLTLLVVSLIVYFRNLSPLIVFAGVIGGAWPDAVRMVYIPFISDSYLLCQFEKFHTYIHSIFTPEPFPSLPVQVLIAVVALLLLF